MKILPKISEIEVYPVKPKNGLVAFCSFVIDENFYICSVAVYSRLNGSANFRLVYPDKLIADKKISLFYPIKKEVGLYIESIISEKVTSVLNQSVNEYVRYSYSNDLGY